MEIPDRFTPEKFEEARQCLPEQQKRQLEPAILEKRKKYHELLDADEGDMATAPEPEGLRKEIEELEKKLEKLGGDTRKRLEEVLAVYEPESHSRWFVDGYDAFERNLFERIIFGQKDFRGLLESFSDKDGKPLPIEQLVVDDRGMGTGRSLRMLMDVVRKRRGWGKARDFAKNAHGIDLMQKNLDEADKLFRKGSYACPAKENYSVGSYLDPSSTRTDSFGTERKKAHLITCMMHSCFYNVTEEDWITFFQNIKNDLLPGGLFIFDTIAMPNFEPREIDKKIPTLGTLRDLYTRLWLRYCKENQQHMPEGTDLLDMPRYPIFDNTTGVDFYWREVPQVEFIDYIFDKIGGGLKWVRFDAQNPAFESREEALKLGLRWIEENGLKDEYSKKIMGWLEDGTVNPSRILGRHVSCDSRKKRRRTAKELMEDVALSMARGYTNTYIYVRRTK